MESYIKIYLPKNETKVNCVLEIENIAKKYKCAILTGSELKDEWQRGCL